MRTMTLPEKKKARATNGQHVGLACFQYTEQPHVPGSSVAGSQECESETRLLRVPRGDHAHLPGKYLHGWSQYDVEDIIMRHGHVHVCAKKNSNQPPQYPQQDAIGARTIMRQTTGKRQPKNEQVCSSNIWQPQKECKNKKNNSDILQL